MPEAKIYKAVRKQREAIERGEVSMLRELTRNWIPGYMKLDKRIRELTEYIEAERKAGREPQMSYFYALDRYKKMMAEAREAVAQYNKAAAGIITGQEADAVQIGAENARELITMEADDPMWTRINKRETRIMTGMLSDESPLNDLLAQSWPEMEQELNSALLAGITTGQNPLWIADQMRKAAGVPQKRALLIARTEVNRAYRAANLETMRSSRAVKGYRRLCYKPTACFACLMLDGEYYDKKEDFSDHPNGKCSAVPVTKRYDPGNEKDWVKGMDWFEELSPDRQRSLMGVGRYELWQDGKVKLEDMVTIKENDLWGGSPIVIPLKKLLDK